MPWAPRDIVSLPATDVDDSVPGPRRRPPTTERPRPPPDRSGRTRGPSGARACVLRPEHADVGDVGPSSPGPSATGLTHIYGRTGFPVWAPG